MELTVHGKQMNVGDALRSHVSEKLEDLNQKYFNHAVFATVTFSREGHGHPRTKAHISIQIGKNIMVIADAVENDPYVSFEVAAQKVGRQLQRYKQKLRDHHERLERTPESEILKASDYVLSGAADEGESPDHVNDDVPQGKDPVVIAEMKTNIESMSVSEAVMRMDLSGQSAILFRNAGHGGVNMLYRRPDGNIGWVDPEDGSKRKAPVKAAPKAKTKPKEKFKKLKVVSGRKKTAAKKMIKKKTVKKKK